MARWKFIFTAVIVAASLSGSHSCAQQPASNTAPAAAESSASPADATVKRGVELGKKGDLDGAIAAFNEAIKIDPTFAPGYQNRGYALFLQHQMDDAILNYGKAIELNPKYEDAWYLRGAARGQQGDFDGAIADFSHAIEINPRHAPAYYNRGHVKYFKGDLAGGLADIDQAVSIAPDFPFSYLIRGLIHRARDERDGATADFQKSVSFNLSLGALWLWVVKMESGNRGIARADLTASAGNPALFKKDGWPAPIADFLLDKITQDQLIAKASEPGAGKEPLCEAWFFAGMAKHFAGDNKSALDCFKQAVASGAMDSEEYAEAQRQITKLQTP